MALSLFEVRFEPFEGTLFVSSSVEHFDGGNRGEGTVHEGSEELTMALHECKKWDGGENDES